MGSATVEQLTSDDARSKRDELLTEFDLTLEEIRDQEGYSERRSVEL